jgi:hypothetical protein
MKLRKKSNKSEVELYLKMKNLFKIFVQAMNISHEVVRRERRKFLSSHFQRIEFEEKVRKDIESLLS